MNRQQFNTRNQWLNRWSRWATRYRALSLCILALVTTSLCILSTPVLAKFSAPNVPDSQPSIQNPKSKIQNLIAQSPSLLDQGRSLYEAGRFEPARTVWEKAEKEYRRQGDRANVTRSRLYQAEALKMMGANPRALEILEELDKTVLLEPYSVEKVQILRSLGEVYAAIGGTENLKKARAALQQSLEIAQTPEAKSAAYAGLGLVDRAEISRISPQTFVINSRTELPEKIQLVLSLLQQQPEKASVQQALENFQNAINASTTPLTTTQAALNQLSFLVNVLPKFNRFLANALNDLQAEFARPNRADYFLKNYLNRSVRLPQFISTTPVDLKEPEQRIIDLGMLTRQTADLTADLPQFLAQVYPKLTNLGSDRARINAQINFAQSLIGLQQVTTSAEEVNRELKAMLETIQKASPKTR
ncbi:MAG: hypothetical protein HC866_27215, partial [Leptolyngbyaceae cyanobacterium RU_5_1]|nr:hypothetical protein [Leptolyngbyaceae cyanobacterium RU_5_1]